MNSTIVWEVDGTQIHSTEQFNNYNTQGYSIQPMNTESESSNMTISMEARVSKTDSNIIVDCLAKHKNELGSNKWEIHHIILICEYNIIICMCDNNNTNLLLFLILDVISTSKELFQ